MIAARKSVYQIASSGVMAMRRGREAGFGSVYSLISIVSGSTLAIRFPRKSTYQAPPSSSPGCRMDTLGCWAASQLHLAGLRIDPPDCARLDREPHHAFVIDDRCVRPAIAFRHWVFVHLAGFRIEHADGVRTMPVYQMLPALSSTRPCGPAPSGSGNSFMSPVLRSRRPRRSPIPRPPERAIARRQRIARARAERGHQPLLDRELDGAFDDYRRGAGFSGKLVAR